MTRTGPKVSFHSVISTTIFVERSCSDGLQKAIIKISQLKSASEMTIFVRSGYHFTILFYVELTLNRVHTILYSTDLGPKRDPSYHRYQRVMLGMALAVVLLIG